MEHHQKDQKLDPCDVKNPKGTLHFHLHEEEETFHSCSSHLRVLPVAISVITLKSLLHHSHTKLNSHINQPHCMYHYSPTQKLSA